MESVSELARWCCCRCVASRPACVWLGPLREWPSRTGSASCGSGDSGICPRLWWERLISRGLAARTVEAAGLYPGKWRSSWTSAGPDVALWRATSEYEILFRWSGLERVDRLGARLSGLSTLATVSPPRGSREYCRLLRGEFSKQRRRHFS